MADLGYRRDQLRLGWLTPTEPEKFVALVEEMHNQLIGGPS